MKTTHVIGGVVKLSPDQVELRRARPYLRSLLAFLVYLRYGPGDRENPFDSAYAMADQFLKRLNDDVGNQ